MQEFKLPDLGEGMQEAEIRRWLVQPGDTVRIDQPLLEVETDKAVVEIPAPVAGQIAEIRFPAGQTAHLGDVLVTFTSPTSLDAPTQSANPAPATSTTLPPPSPQPSSTSVAPQQRILASPAVRQRAFQAGIDLAHIPAQLGGRISMEDLIGYIEQSKEPAKTASASAAPISAPSNTATVASTQEERTPLTGLRKQIAEHMERSWRTIPHATAFDEVDGSALVALRQSLQPLAEERGVHLTYLPFFIKLLLPVLKEFPLFNASLDDEHREIVYKRCYHIGIATATAEGLLVPVLRDADRLTLLQIAQQLALLVEGARKRTLTRSELSGSTFTLNNIGSFGASSGTPIINHPEVAILAPGRLQEKAIVRTGVLQPCMMLPLALAFDHRLIDGALAGRFLLRFKQLIERPQQLLLDIV